MIGAFGETTSIAGTDFGFTGQRYDADLGLYYYKMRFYSPKLGRFLQPDPVGYTGEDLNLYSYVANSPLKYNDPLGTFAWWVILIIILLLLILLAIINAIMSAIAEQTARQKESDYRKADESVNKMKVPANFREYDSEWTKGHARYKDQPTGTHWDYNVDNDKWYWLDNEGNWHEGTPYPNKTYAKPLDVLGNDTTIYSPFGGAPFEANTIQTYGSGSSSSSVGFALA